jgi:hypothetical protein
MLHLKSHKLVKHITGEKFCVSLYDWFLLAYEVTVIISVSCEFVFFFLISDGLSSGTGSFASASLETSYLVETRDCCGVKMDFDCGALGCGDVWSCRWLPALRRNVPPLSLGYKVRSSYECSLNSSLGSAFTVLFL